MIEALRIWLLELLRIPQAPHVPPGEESASIVFRADPDYYRLRVWGWTGKQCLTALGLVVGMTVLYVALNVPIQHKVAKFVRHAPTLFKVLEGLAILGFLVQLPFGYLALRWDYECRFYVLTDRCLRIQEGLWTFREQTFTLANIQNLDVRQGPLQRYFGLSDLVVRTAGGGEADPDHPGQATSLHEGRLRGLRDASGVKARILERMKQMTDAGLGDPEDAPPSMDLAAAAREATEAVRGLLDRMGAQSPS